MKVSFTVPAYNEEKYIGPCLDAIMSEVATLPAPHTSEVIVVNNASTDGTVAVVREKYPGVVIVNETRKGLVRARQAGFIAAHGDIIAAIDADTLIQPGWLKKVVHAFEKDESLVGLSGPYVYYDLSRFLNALTFVWYGVGFIVHCIGRALHRGAMMQGGNFVVRRTALEKIGGFDTNIEFYGEDTDVAKRLSRVGKVSFRFTLIAHTSGRRLAKEGVLRTSARYAANFASVILLGKPVTKQYKDIRP
jgi:glycosyltransferase involved in cell wall biosynthesis